MSPSEKDTLWEISPSKKDKPVKKKYRITDKEEPVKGENK